MLLDRQKAKFWQRIVFAAMAFLMVAWLVGMGISQITGSSGATDQSKELTKNVEQRQAALDAEPTSAAATLALAQAYMARGNVSEDGSEAQIADLKRAVDLFERYLAKKDTALGADPKTARLLALQSLVSLHQRLGDAAGALSDWNRIVELQPGSVQNWLFLATAASAADKTGVALLAYEKALDLDPKGEYADEIRSQITALKAQVKAQEQAPQSTTAPVGS